MMDIEVVLPNESAAMPAHALVDLARAAESLGYTTAWLPDHLLPPGEYGTTFGGVYEPLVTIGHLAAVTERLRLGTSVLIAPLRDPFLLAKQVASLHQISGGRVVLGLGVGWNEPEFEALGADYRHRGAITDDTLDLLSHLFSGGTAPYRGRRFSHERGVFAPVPDGKVPVMVGGSSDAALCRAARYADIWQSLPASPQDFAEQARRLADVAVDRHVGATVRIAWDEAMPVERFVDDVIAYRDAGAAQVAVHFGEYDGTHVRMESLAETLRRR